MLLISGIVLVVLGLVFTFTGIGAILGVPMMIFGLLLGVLGFTGAVLGIVFGIVKLILMIVFSPLIIVAWLIRWLWHVIF